MSDLLDYAEAAEYLTLREKYLHRLVSERRIPFLKLGHAVRFDRDELDRWLDSKRVPAKVPEKEMA